jgi:ParB family chromosome partitioning protein
MMKKVLGRGIEALISQDLRESVSETERVKDLDIEHIDPNPRQPRAHFDGEHLKELADSIRQNGVLQPIVVRRVENRYELILGERRLRAAKLAGKPTIPAIVREIDDADSLRHALMENLQREDLNPIEEARGYQALKDGFGLAIGDIAEMIGKNRSTIANSLRLLNLPEVVKILIIEGKLTAGHARALLAIEGEAAQIEWARRIVSESLTVREIEHTAPGKTRGKKRRGARKLSPEIQAIEEAIETHLGTRAKIAPRSKGGILWIEYYSDEELERVLEKMGIRIPL